MLTTRRKFIRAIGLAGAAPSIIKAAGRKIINSVPENESPIILSTWPQGKRCNEAAIKSLAEKGDILTAIEEGIHILENDPDEHSVGLGGFPDFDGEVTLDASIMDWKGNAGGVCYLKNIKNPISVARLVMEKTKHVLLAGDGARKFAVQNGFKEENLLTDFMKRQWLKKRGLGKDFINHDTIGMLILDKKGRISGGVSTSGWAYKAPGRVGDSPIIGAGLFVDGEIGAACSTGVGELAMKTLGSFLIVEKMRDGYSPEDACKFAVERIERKYFNDGKHFSIAFIALSVNGGYGGYSSTDGFKFSLTTEKESRIIDSKYIRKRKK